MTQVALAAGTRPEAVKIAPLASALRSAGLDPIIVDTGQQPGRVAEALAPFGLSVDENLAVERRDGGLAELISLVVSAADRYLARSMPDAVLVQGDTTSAMAVGMAAAMARIPLAHLEAGLRTGDRTRPFPEETNRMVLASLADLHLAPTSRAAAALAREGHTSQDVVVTGNTVVDALRTLLPRLSSRPLSAVVTVPAGRRLLTVTVHRREAWGAGVKSVAAAVADLLAAESDLHAVVVTHPNPAVADDVRAVLSDVDRCTLLPPLPYDDMLTLLSASDVALTDSGGIQEEAPTLRLPVVVAREVTERPEGVAAGWAILVGLDRDAMVTAVRDWLRGRQLPAAAESPYGDGRAAGRCAAAVAWLLGRGDRPEDWTA